MISAMTCLVFPTALSNGDIANTSRGRVKTSSPGCRSKSFLHRACLDMSAYPDAYPGAWWSRAADHPWLAACHLFMFCTILPVFNREVADGRRQATRADPAVESDAQGGGADRRGNPYPDPRPVC